MLSDVAGAGGGNASPNSERCPKFDFTADGSVSPGRIGDGKQHFENTPVKHSDSSKPREAFNREMYRIPSYAGWFSWGKIHTIEHRSLPEFFDGRSLSKTPKIYKEYREFIINKYRENPHRVLTFTEVRRMLIGDVNLLRKVYDFLDYWGLINFHANKTENLTEASDKSLINKDAAPSDMKVQETVAENSVTTKSNEVPPGIRIVYPDSQSAKPATTVNTMKDAHTQPTGAPSEDVGDSQKTAKSDVSQPSDADWTTEEVLRLLEAVTKYGDEWNRVAHHVGTKSKSQCVMQFAKLPFGDQFASDVGASPPELTSTVQNILNVSQNVKDGEYDPAEMNSNPELTEPFNEVVEPPLKRNKLTPLADSSNPILAQVAFLCAMVGPRVAAAAAQAAVNALSEDDPISNIGLPSSVQIVEPVQKDPSNTTIQSSSKDSESLENRDTGEELPSKEDPGPSNENGASKGSATHIRASIGTTIGAIAAKAKLLVEQEEREVEHLMANIIEDQLKKLQSKVDHFEELEFLLEREQLQIEKARDQVVADWIRFSHYHYNSAPSADS